MSTMIYFLNNQDKVKITYKAKSLIRKAISTTLEHEGFDKSAQISLTFTDNEGIKRLNSEFRGIDRETDVLSFPLIDFAAGEAAPDGTDEVMLGDIVLSLEMAESQAALFGHSTDREIAFLCIHSTLHLLGYDHIEEEDELIMRAAQREILAEIGLNIK